jgi:hypothetical protein
LDCVWYPTAVEPTDNYWEHEMLNIKSKVEDSIKGHVRIGLFDTSSWQFTKILHEQQNLFMKSGADLLAGLLAGGPGMGIRGMYLEFDNDTLEPVAPSYDRDSDISYYTNSLGASRDYLRVPLASQPMVQASDATYLGNQVSFFAVAAAGTGENGEQDFQSGSWVYGGALVAMPDINDQSKDYIAARTYWATDSIKKDASHQVAVQWTLTIF